LQYFNFSFSLIANIIASTGATLELILADDTEKVNRNEISHTIKNIEKILKARMQNQ